MTNVHEMGVVAVTWPVLNFNALNHISGTTEDTVVTFCVHVGHINLVVICTAYPMIWVMLPLEFWGNKR